MKIGKTEVYTALASSPGPTPARRGPGIHCLRMRVIFNAGVAQLRQDQIQIRWNESTKVQTLGELRMRGNANVGWAIGSLLLVARGESDTGYPR